MKLNPRLSVNLNKIALLRNSRETGVPNLIEFAKIAKDNGADGLTIHPRPDGRHIRSNDVFTLSQFMEPYRPGFELNIEGYPDERLAAMVRVVRPEQCTLVPDPPNVLTSTAGWRLDNYDQPIVVSAVSSLKRIGCRVILFADPDPSVVPRIAETGADGIEIYTGAYAANARLGNFEEQLDACAETALIASSYKLIVNIGHDLNIRILPPLLARLPMVAEASIGHELTSDALISGFGPAVAAYKRALLSLHSSQN